VRPVPDGVEKFAKVLIDDATQAAIQTNRDPKTREDILNVFGAIQLALVKHNLLQPSQEKDWPQTLGIALTPLSLTQQEMDRELSFSINNRRKSHFDMTKPFYYVDCDMGSEIFLAVGERQGWYIRLVGLPQHEFVRWHLSNTSKVNWDWVLGSSLKDSEYPTSSSSDVRLSTLYLRSFEAKEARAYYLGLIGSEATRPEDAERLLLEAVAVMSSDPLTLNNLAWLYATSPSFAKDKNKSALAIAYGLAAWSTSYSHGNFADTVACAFAADGNKALAAKVEEFAIEHPDDDNQRDGFRNNLERINRGELCK